MIELYQSNDKSLKIVTSNKQIKVVRPLSVVLYIVADGGLLFFRALVNHADIFGYYWP